MDLQKILPSGWVASTTFITGSLILGGLLQDYSSVSQTVSEIGKIGSPFYLPWQIFSVAVGLLIILFGIGILTFAKQNKLSILPGIFMFSYGVSQAGVGIFPSPLSLHNVFGLSMTLGYFSPLVFALSWGSKLGKSFGYISYLAFVLIILGIILNLTPVFAPTLYSLEYYGIVQRFLLFTFYLYVAYVSFRTASLVGS
jgi:hypothetical protein